MFIITLNQKRKSVNKTLWLFSVLPAMYLFACFLTGDMGDNPFDFLMRYTGQWASIFFVCSYAITPVRRWLRYMASIRKWRMGKRLSDWNFLIYNRRLLGLCSFYYACIHFWIYLYFEIDLELAELYLEVSERIFIAFGVLGWLILFFLAVTSPDFAQKKLKRNWRRIHRLAYLFAIILLGHIFYEAKVYTWDLWLYLLLITVFSMHRLLVTYLAVFWNKDDDGMIAVRNER